ncbi:MAG: Re/Si-specific NAD(P)(+) transhydrogenase subunit alpha [Polyangiales bacterium]
MPTIFVPKESSALETRVACSPDTAKRLIKEGFTVIVERGAGEHAHFTDDAYADVGATLGDTAAATAADVIVKVAAPTHTEIGQYKKGAILISFMAPHKNLDTIVALRDRGVSVFAMELVPRISRAQTMDALSSQASIAGYKAVLLAAANLDKYFPLLMTAAGTIQPARVVIMGAGVAGLQAIATAKRLGAVVEVSDIRPAVKEQVESLGGRFIDFPLEGSGEGEGGYAKELSAEQLKAQQAIVAERVIAADAVITTALVPGRPAPRLITKEMVQQMRTGAVIVDMAVEQGGNCELSEPGKTVVREGVTIIGELNLPATIPADASLMYARNIQALLLLIGKGGTLNIDLDDEVVAGTLLTHDGAVRHEPTQKAITEKQP